MKILKFNLGNINYNINPKVNINVFKGKDVWFFESPELKILDYVSVEDAPTEQDVLREVKLCIHKLFHYYKNTDDFLISDLLFDRKSKFLTYVKRM